MIRISFGDVPRDSWALSSAFRHTFFGLLRPSSVLGLATRARTHACLQLSRPSINQEPVLLFSCRFQALPVGTASERYVRGPCYAGSTIVITSTHDSQLCALGFILTCDPNLMVARRGIRSVRIQQQSPWNGVIHRSERLLVTFCRYLHTEYIFKFTLLD